MMVFLFISRLRSALQAEAGSVPGLSSVEACKVVLEMGEAGYGGGRHVEDPAKTSGNKGYGG
jgi:hypothetical protein